MSEDGRDILTFLSGGLSRVRSNAGKIEINGGNAKWFVWLYRVLGRSVIWA